MNLDINIRYKKIITTQLNNEFFTKYNNEFTNACKIQKKNNTTIKFEKHTRNFKCKQTEFINN